MKININGKEFLNKFNRQELIKLKDIFFQYAIYETNDFSLELLNLYYEVLSKMKDTYLTNITFNEDWLNSKDFKYSELLLLHHMYDVNSLHNDSDDLTYVKDLINENIKFKEQLVRLRIMPEELWTLDEYEVLLNITTGDQRELYATSCNVSEEDLDANILYNTYHKTLKK